MIQEVEMTVSKKTTNKKQQKHNSKKSNLNNNEVDTAAAAAEDIDMNSDPESTTTTTTTPQLSTVTGTRSQTKNKLKSNTSTSTTTTTIQASSSPSNISPNLLASRTRRATAGKHIGNEIEQPPLPTSKRGAKLAQSNVNNNTNTTTTGRRKLNSSSSSTTKYSDGESSDKEMKDSDEYEEKSDDDDDYQDDEDESESDELTVTITEQQMSEDDSDNNSSRTKKQPPNSSGKKKQPANNSNNKSKGKKTAAVTKKNNSRRKVESSDEMEESDEDYIPPSKKKSETVSKAKSTTTAAATSKRKSTKQATKPNQRKKAKHSSVILYSDEENESEEEEEEEEESHEEYSVSGSSGDEEYYHSDDEQVEKGSGEEDDEVAAKDTIDDKLETFDDEFLERIITAKIFKGKFFSLPKQFAKYVDFTQNIAIKSKNSNIKDEESSKEVSLNGINTPTSTTTENSTTTSPNLSSTTINTNNEPDKLNISENNNNNNSSELTSKLSQPTSPQLQSTTSAVSVAASTTPNLTTNQTPPVGTPTIPTNNNNAQTTSVSTTTEGELSSDEETRYLILLKDKSYRTLRWMTYKELASTNTTQKLTFILKRSMTSPIEPIKSESEANPLNYINSDYIQVDKILTKETKRRKGVPETFYLVKWRGLLHEKSTWESENSLKSPMDLAAIKIYNQMQVAPANTSIIKKGQTRPKLPAFEPALVPKFKESLALKEFQVEGFLWLSYCWHHERSSLLADEMGLGKTIQTIAFLQYLSQTVGMKGPFMVVAPLSTLGNWQKEIQKWTDMRVMVFYGSQETRQCLKKYEWRRKDKSYYFEILLTTYETVMAEHLDIVKVHWKCLVLDEGHRIKNVNSKVLSRLKSIRTDHSVILTGTPLQNDMKELWTMLNFLDPSKFNNCTEFLEEFSDLKEESQVQRLHQILSPYLLRRMKEDVELSIPIKEETVIQVELTSTQKTYYRAILEKNREFLARGVRMKSNLPKLTNIMIQIRKVCNHPFLIPGAEETIIKQEKLKTDEQIAELLIRSSSKLVLVDKLLQRLKVEGHKVLIFSQMVESLNILEDYLHYREYPYERLDGSVKSETRQQSIERFMEKDSDRFVFLLSTRSGGVGINLTSADTVILFDSDWNPQSDLQAQARCHRIGQTSNVKVYRLITRNTYEQYLFEVATKKLLLDHIVLNNAKNNNSMKQQQAEKNGDTATTMGDNGTNEAKEEDEQAKKEDGDQTTTTTTTSSTTPASATGDTNNPSEISQMLKYGAAYLFNETAKDASEQDSIMFNEDIDKVLERSTTISFDNKNKPSNLSGFSKATFASNENDMNVDIDDENFWEKVLPDYKSVKQLEEKLSSGSIFANDEVRSKYIDDIVTLGQSKKDDVDSITVEFISDLLKLIMRIEFNPKFTQDERDRATGMRLMLERPRSRKRIVPEVLTSGGQDKDNKNKKNSKATSVISMPESESSSDENGGSDTDFVHDGEEVDSEYETVADPRQTAMGKKGAFPTSANTNVQGSIPSQVVVPTWPKTSKDRLKAILFRYGFHRWKKIQKELAISCFNKSPLEIQSVSESFLEVGLKFQHLVMSDFFNSFVDDTSLFNWHRIGFNIDKSINVTTTISTTSPTSSSPSSPTSTSVNNSPSLKNSQKLNHYHILEVNNNIPLITGQSININWTIDLPSASSPQLKDDSTNQQQQDTNNNNVNIKKEESNNNLNNANNNNNNQQTQLSYKNPIKTNGYYLALFVQEHKEHQLIRAFPITEGMNSIEIFFPGLNGTYVAKIIYTNPSHNQYQIVSNEMIIATTPNIIWQQLDFPSFATRVQSILTKLVQMRSLKQLVVKYGKNLSTLKIIPQARGPTPSWTPENDKSLLIGVYKYGYGKYNEVFMDPALDLLSSIKKGQILSTSSGNLATTTGNLGSGDDEFDDVPQPANPAIADKIPSSESLRRRITKITDTILKNEQQEKIRQQAMHLQHQALMQHQQHLSQHQQQHQHQHPSNSIKEESDGSSKYDAIDISDDEPNFTNHPHKPKSHQQQHQQQQQQYNSHYSKSHQHPSSSRPQLPSISNNMGISQIINSNSISMKFEWQNKIYLIGVPSTANVEFIRKIFVTKLQLANSLGPSGENKDYILRFYLRDQTIPQQTKILDLDYGEKEIVTVRWESKWKTIQVRGFDHEPILMKVQDDTVLEDIVKAYFLNTPPPYEIKNLRVEVDRRIVSLNTDIGTNNIRNDTTLNIVSSPDIIHVHVMPSWGGDKEIYALHKKTTFLSKLIDSFLKKHNLQAKQIHFINRSTNQVVDPNQTPHEQHLNMDSQITAHLVLVRLDVVLGDQSVPYLLSTNTSFDSLMQRFSERLGLNKLNYAFIYNAKVLVPEENPDQIKMGPHATIHVILKSPQQQQQHQQPNIIEVEVRLVGQDAGSYIKMHTLNPFPLRILMDKFCQEHQLSPQQVLFKFNGAKVNPNDTLNTIGLQNNDVIECYML